MGRCVSIDSRDGRRYMAIKIKQSKTDISRGGAERPLVEADSILRPAETFILWKETPCGSSDEKHTISGINLRTRVSAVMKMAAMANGVYDQRIDTHSLRAGGATALYTQGIPLDVIQRRGRWNPLTFHQYMWNDASPLNHLSEIAVKSHGLLGSLKLMNKNAKQNRFQKKLPTTSGRDEEQKEGDNSTPTSLFWRMKTSAMVDGLPIEPKKIMITPSHRLTSRPIPLPLMIPWRELGF